MSLFKTYSQKEIKGDFNDNLFVHFYAHSHTGYPVVSLEAGPEYDVAFQSPDRLRELGQYLCDLAFDMEGRIANGQ